MEDSDKGAYKLVASNEKGEAVSQVVNLVDIPEEERKPLKPEITRRLMDQKVIESKTFELLISLKQSDRKCKVEWFKGSTLIRETKDITTTFDGTTARLTFSSARSEHTSNYKVVVLNEAGKDESTCKVTVEKKDKKKDEQAEQEKEEAERKRKVTKTDTETETEQVKPQESVQQQQQQNQEQIQQQSIKVQKLVVDNQEIKVVSKNQQSVLIVEQGEKQQISSSLQEQQVSSSLQEQQVHLRKLSVHDKTSQSSTQIQSKLSTLSTVSAIKLNIPSYIQVKFKFKIL